MDSLEVRGPHLLVSGTVKLRRALMPPFVEQIWHRAIAHADLRCRPHFFTVQSMNGAGGIYTSGAVVVGLEDLHDLADRLAHASGFRVPSDAELRWLRRHAPERLITANHRLIAAAEHLIHHELGHALAHQWGRSLEGPAEEAQADAVRGAVRGPLWLATRTGPTVLPHHRLRHRPLLLAPLPRPPRHAFDQGYQTQLRRQIEV